MMLSEYFVVLIPCILGNCYHFFIVCIFFSKYAYSKNSFLNTIRVSNSLDLIIPWYKLFAFANGISSGSALFAKIKTIFRDRNISFYLNFALQPLNVQNEQKIQIYCIIMYGNIHQNEKC